MLLPSLGWGHPKDTAVLDLFPFVIHLVQEDFLNLQVMQRCLPMTAGAAPPLPLAILSCFSMQPLPPAAGQGHPKPVITAT